MKKLIGVLFALAIALALAAVTAHAAPALSIPQEYQQPDGSTFTATLRGDEYFHFLEAQDGSILTQGDDGYWYYAETREFTVDGEAAAELTPSQARYRIGEAPPEYSRTTKDQLRDDAFQYRRREMRVRTAPNVGPQAAPSIGIQATPGLESQAADKASFLGDQSLLVILVDFNDISIKYEGQWAQHVFGTTGKTVKTYFNEATGGKINFVPAQETYGSANDGVVRVKLNRNHPNTAFPDDYADVFAAASSYVDFASYNVTDTYNPDSELHIMLIYAGYKIYSSDPAPGIWGHYAGTHMAMGEVTMGNMATIGTFCHELGHSLGLPDLGRAGWDDETEPIPMRYSLMDTGFANQLPGEPNGTTPALLDAWCLVDLGIISPQVVDLGSNISTSVKSWSTGAKNILKVASGVPNEYFLIECRNKEGFDLALPGDRGGVAVYRINTGIRGNISNGMYAVIMLKLDWIENNHAYGELFFSTRPSGRTYFNAETTPSNKLGYGGGYSWFRFDCLSISGPSMNVKIQPDKPSGFYAITYNANGGSGGPSTQYKKHGENLILNNALSLVDFVNYTVPIRSGYTFLGWATSSVATTAQYQPGGTFTVNADTTLYAVWRQNATVKYIFTTGYEATFFNWILFIVFFGWLWMWF